MTRSEEQTHPLHTNSGRRTRFRLRNVLFAIPGLVLVLLAGLWLARIPLLDQAIRSFLTSRGITGAEWTLEEAGFQGVKITGFRTAGGDGSSFSLDEISIRISDLSTDPARLLAGTKSQIKGLTLKGRQDENGTWSLAGLEKLAESDDAPEAAEDHEALSLLFPGQITLSDISVELTDADGQHLALSTDGEITPDPEKPGDFSASLQTTLEDISGPDWSLSVQSHISILGSIQTDPEGENLSAGPLSVTFSSQSGQLHLKNAALCTDLLLCTDMETSEPEFSRRYTLPDMAGDFHLGRGPMDARDWRSRDSRMQVTFLAPAPEDNRGENPPPLLPLGGDITFLAGKLAAQECNVISPGTSGPLARACLNAALVFGSSELEEAVWLSEGAENDQLEAGFSIRVSGGIPELFSSPPDQPAEVTLRGTALLDSNLLTPGNGGPKRPDCLEDSPCPTGFHVQADLSASSVLIAELGQIGSGTGSFILEGQAGHSVTENRLHVQANSFEILDAKLSEELAAEFPFLSDINRITVQALQTGAPSGPTPETDENTLLVLQQSTPGGTIYGAGIPGFSLLLEGKTAKLAAKGDLSATLDSEMMVLSNARIRSLSLQGRLDDAGDRLPDGLNFSLTGSGDQTAEGIAATVDLTLNTPGLVETGGTALKKVELRAPLSLEIDGTGYRIRPDKSVSVKVAKGSVLTEGIQTATNLDLTLAPLAESENFLTILSGQDRERGNPSSQVSGMGNDDGGQENNSYNLVIRTRVESHDTVSLIVPSLGKAPVTIDNLKLMLKLQTDPGFLSPLYTASLTSSGITLTPVQWGTGVTELHARSQAQDETSFAAGKGALAGLPKLDLKVQNLREIAALPVISPLDLSLSAIPEGNGWVLRGQGKIPDNKPGLSFSGFQSLDGSGSGRLTLPGTELGKRGLPLGKLFPVTRDVLEDSSGKLSLAVDAGWTRKGHFSTVSTIGLEDFSARTGNIRFRNINSRLELAGPWPVTTRKQQKVTLDNLDAGLKWRDAVLEFSLPEADHLNISRFEIHTGDGRLFLEPVALDLRKLPLKANLRVESVSLETVFDLVGEEDIGGAGLISGLLPLVFTISDFGVEKGRLEADGPGYIAYAPESVPGDMNQGISMAIQALQNFQYEKLTLDVDRDHQGETVLGLHIAGANPDFYDGYPVEFNLNLSGALEKIARNLLFGYSLPAQIEKRLNRFR